MILCVEMHKLTNELMSPSYMLSVSGLVVVIGNKVVVFGIVGNTTWIVPVTTCNPHYDHE